jgi:uncharacterized membrane protein YccC
MTDAKKWIKRRWKRQDLIHSARTAVAALVSLEIARLFHLPEAYWAAITTMIVMQSTLGAALTVSEQRFAGTALGCAAGALVAAYFPPSAVLFSVAVFLLGILGALVGLERNAYRFAGITLAIVVLVERSRPAWLIAAHRFIEVTIGIAVALLLTALWPERDPAGAAGH